MKHKEDNIFEITAQQFEQFVNLPAVKHVYDYHCFLKHKPSDYVIEGLEGRRWFKFNDIVYVVAQ